MNRGLPASTCSASTTSTSRHRDLPLGNLGAGHEKYDSQYVLDRQPDIIILTDDLSSRPWQREDYAGLNLGLIAARIDIVKQDRLWQEYEPRTVELGGEVVQHARAPRRGKRAGADARGRASLNGARPGKAWGGRFAQPTDATSKPTRPRSTSTPASSPTTSPRRSRTPACSAASASSPSKDADAIVRGLAEILEEYARGDFVLRADLEDVHMNVEARLAAKIGGAAGRLHTARSRNDQVATDFRMYVKSACGARDRSASHA